MKMKPKVSVFMITYNHQKFIGEAIESVMNQDYENIELVIGEDCSTDNTLEIVKKYKDKYSEKIKLILHKQNVGMHRNTESVIKACDGDYVALIEGDDYWTDNQKISKQVKFLEENKDYAICFHRSKIVNDTNVPFAEYLPSLQNRREEFSIYDFIDGLYMPTASTVFRNNKIHQFPEWYFNLSLYIDRMFHLMNGQYGKIKFLNETMSVYRVHSGGFWSIHQDENKVKTLKERIYLLENFNNYSINKYEQVIKYAVQKCKMEILVEETAKNIQLPLKVKKRLRGILDITINDRDIYLFGSGRAGQKALDFLKYLGYSIKGYLDNDQKKWNTEVNAIKVECPKTFDYRNKVIFIASEFHKEIGQQLEYCGLVADKDFYVFLNLLSEKQELMV